MLMHLRNKEGKLLEHDDGVDCKLLANSKGLDG